LKDTPEDFTRKPMIELKVEKLIAFEEKRDIIDKKRLRLAAIER
jgi:hypothetical protein